MARRALRHLRTFWRYPLFVKAWLLPTWFFLGFLRLLILVTSFRRLVGLLGHEQPLDFRPAPITERQADRAAKIGRVIEVAARYTPWTSNCFPQALCAGIYLRLYRVPFVAFMGLRRAPESQQIQAHAWTVAGATPVSGGQQNDTYTVVAAFSPKTARS